METLSAQALTYADVYPIIQKKCVICHNHQGSAPFSLEQYSDLVKRKSIIRYVIDQSIMPPWKANNHYREFANNKALSPEEKMNILAWIDTGAKPGNTIKPTAMDALNGVRVNTQPDLILSMKKAYKVRGNNSNTYICYKIPYQIERDTFVSAIEFIPGNRSVVHHASYQILEVAPDVDIKQGPDYFEYDADTLNRVDDAHDYRYLQLVGKRGEMPVEHYHGGWLPGTSLQHYPPEIGFYLPKKGVLLIRNLHYAPTPIDQMDSSSLRIYFAPVRPSRKMGFAAFKPARPHADTIWKIPAGTSSFKAQINVRFHQDISLLNINPHMHQLGISFKAYALTPQGDTIRLIDIPEWDHNWQEFYRFKTMLKIPAGSLLHAEAVYDNSTANPENPFQPPRDILFESGMNETSEMMRLVFLFLPYEARDERISLE
ncbi:MAG: cytochrome c [Bacteroidia bacterium]